MRVGGTWDLHLGPGQQKGALFPRPKRCTASQAFNFNFAFACGIPTLGYAHAACRVQPLDLHWTSTGTTARGPCPTWDLALHARVTT